jgi:phosphoribosylformylglycinamidine synthase
MKPKILIFTGYGLNCDDETKLAFEKAGGIADTIHINDLISGRYRMDNYQVLVFQGGFSYGDDTGAGNAYASKLKNNLWPELINFIQKDKLIIGICNGFQILVNLGLIPALNRNFGHRQAALIQNDFPRYQTRWVDLKVINKSPWLLGIQKISLPIAHGEGKFYAVKDILTDIENKNMIALKYYSGEMCERYDLPANPNGSLLNIAGVTDESGRILGLMPHPERAQDFFQLPHWQNIKEDKNKLIKIIPKKGPGLAIFENAIKYFS